MSSNTEEATVNPDGSTTYGSADVPPTGGAGPESDEPDFAEAGEDVPGSEEIVDKGTDPAIYLALAFIGIVLLYYFFHRRGKKKQMEREAFFLRYGR